MSTNAFELIKNKKDKYSPVRKVTSTEEDSLRDSFFVLFVLLYLYLSSISSKAFVFLCPPLYNSRFYSVFFTRTKNFFLYFYFADPCYQSAGGYLSQIVLRV